MTPIEVENTKIHTRIQCDAAQELLALKFAEVQLSDMQAKRLQVHLGHCANCSTFSFVTDHLSALPPQSASAPIMSSEKMDRAVSDVMKQLSFDNNPSLVTALPTGLSKKKVRRRRVMVSALAAVILGGFFLFAVSQFREGAPRQKMRSVCASVDCTSRLPQQVASDIWVATYQGKSPEVSLQRTGTMVLHMNAGMIAVAVTPAERNRDRVVVETPHGIVHVKGTRFWVWVNANDTTVAVVRGHVAVQPRAKQAVAIDLWVGYAVTISNPSPVKIDIEETLPLFAQFPKASTAEPRGDGADGVKTIHASESALNTLGELNALNDEVDADSAERSATTQRPKRSSDPRESYAGLTQEAHRCMLSKQYDCAALAYRTIISQFKGRPEAMTSLVSLAKIELRHLHAPQRALTLYRQYYRQRPTGPLAEEALYGIATAHRALGKRAEEIQALQKFTQTYPESPMAGSAQARLTDLSVK